MALFFLEHAFESSTEAECGQVPWPQPQRSSEATPRSKRRREPKDDHSKREPPNSKSLCGFETLACACSSTTGGGGPWNGLRPLVSSGRSLRSLLDHRGLRLLLDHLGAELWPSPGCVAGYLGEWRSL
jgi:hypothetical protein